MTITGTNLTGATSVKFGTTPATSFTRHKDHQDQRMTKAHAAGTVKISVTTPGGTATSSASFTFVAPRPRPSPRFTPTSGSTSVGRQ